MAIVVNLDVMMAKRKMTLSQLSEKVDITLANLSILKNNNTYRTIRRKSIRSFPADTALYAKEDLGSWETFGICSTP